MIAKMTAVEYLEEIIYGEKEFSLSEVFNQAKEMENSQRQKDFKAGNECACMEHENIEDYFNQYIKSN